MWQSFDYLSISHRPP